MMAGLSDHRPTVVEETPEEEEVENEREAPASLAKKYWKAGVLPHLAFVMRVDEVDEADTLAEQLIEWADAANGIGEIEVGGESATESLAVVKAGIKSAREGRHVEVAEILASRE